MDAINKKIVKELMAIKGDAIGSIFIADNNYVLKREGQEAIEKIREAAKKLDCPIPLDVIDKKKWYPIGLRVILLLLIKQVLNWRDFEIRKMGYEAPESSFTLRLLIKFLGERTKFFKEAPAYWNKFYTIGKLRIVSINEESTSAVLHLENFKVHPVLCGVYLEGYFEKLYQLMMGERARCKHSKCVFKDSPYCEYVFWLKQEPKPLFQNF